MSGKLRLMDIRVNAGDPVYYSISMEQAGLIGWRARIWIADTSLAVEEPRLMASGWRPTQRAAAGKGVRFIVPIGYIDTAEALRIALSLAPQEANHAVSLRYRFGANSYSPEMLAVIEPPYLRIKYLPKRRHPQAMSPSKWQLCARIIRTAWFAAELKGVQATDSGVVIEPSRAVWNNLVMYCMEIMALVPLHNR